MLKLYRDYETENCTMGRLFVDGKEFCATLEPKWLDNQNNISCLPYGNYEIVPRTVGNYQRAYSKRFGHEFSLEIKDVGKRAVCLIHTGNTHKDTRGCVIVGIKPNPHASVVYSSRAMYSGLYDLIKEAVRAKDCPFEIVRCYTENNEAEHVDRENL